MSVCACVEFLTHLFATIKPIMKLVSSKLSGEAILPNCDQTNWLQTLGLSFASKEYSVSAMTIHFLLNRAACGGQTVNNIFSITLNSVASTITIATVADDDEYDKVNDDDDDENMITILIYYTYRTIFFRKEIFLDIFLCSEGHFQ